MSHIFPALVYLLEPYFVQFSQPCTSRVLPKGREEAMVPLETGVFISPNFSKKEYTHTHTHTHTHTPCWHHHCLLILSLTLRWQMICPQTAISQSKGQTVSAHIAAMQGTRATD